MSTLLDSNMPGLEEASRMLADLEQAEGTADAGEIPGQAVQREDGSTSRAGADPASGAQQPDSTKSDTQSAEARGADAAAAAKANEPEKSQEQGKPGDKSTKTDARDEKGRFAKSQERLNKTWDEVNKRKTDLETRQQQLDQRENALKQQQADYERQQQQAQAQHTPEQYEQAAGAKLKRAEELNLQAESLENRATKLEDDGKVGEAQRIREQAKQLRKKANQEEGNAEDLRAHADHLRKNPPPTAKQLSEKFESDRKQWTMKAAEAFPELAKQGSDLQKAVAQHLNVLQQNDPELLRNPRIIYHVTRLAAAETAAARVPGLEKELAAAKAKVKELEEFTAPGGAGSAQRPPSGNQPKTDEEEGEALREEAMSMGGIR